MEQADLVLSDRISDERFFLFLQSVNSCKFLTSSYDMLISSEDGTLNL